jgi:hypothetical protein
MRGIRTRGHLGHGRFDHEMTTAKKGRVCAMSEVTSPDIRSKITDDEFGGFRITIPARGGGRWANGFGLALWTLGLAMSLWYIIADPSRHVSDGVKFLLLWAMIGLALGYGAMSAWTGREVMIIEGKALELRREIAGLRSTHTFELSEVRNLRPVRPSEVRSRHGRSNSVAFEHRGLTYHFGTGLSEQEVVRLVKTIRSRFLIRDDWNDAEPLPVIQ